MPIDAAMNPKILLVEDDATSAAFLAAAVEALPSTVDLAGSLVAARAAVKNVAYALWLFDANLPDGSGVELLKSLRSQGHRVPAIAHTAAHERSALDVLIDAGFDEVLVKPLSAAQLQDTVRRVLRSGCKDAAATAATGHKLPVWDNAAAIAALNGSLGNVRALRKLCLSELPQARDDIATVLSRGDTDGLHRILHKLRASCGFVGASRLGSAVRALHEAPGSRAALDRFHDALQDTLSSPD